MGRVHFNFGLSPSNKKRNEIIFFFFSLLNCSQYFSRLCFVQFFMCASHQGPDLVFFSLLYNLNFFLSRIMTMEAFARNFPIIIFHMLRGKLLTFVDDWEAFPTLTELHEKSIINLSCFRLRAIWKTIFSTSTAKKRNTRMMMMMMMEN